MEEVQQLAPLETVEEYRGRLELVERIPVPLHLELDRPVEHFQSLVEPVELIPVLLRRDLAEQSHLLVVPVEQLPMVHTHK